jgi:peptide/nickel transport system substrate-binding protein
LIALLSALMVVIAACGGDATTDTTGEAGTDTTEAGGTTETTAAPDDTEATEGGTGGYCATEGGTLIWAHEQEPPDMHLDDPNNNLSITSWIRQSMLDGLYGITADTTFFPELLAEEAVITENGDGTVTGAFVLRDGLVWSDGDDLTADDVKFTYDAIIAGYDAETGEGGIYLIGDRTGYDTITDFTVTSPTEFSITWSAYYAGFKAILSEVFPSHAFSADPATAAAELNAALPEWTLASGDKVPVSGAMQFDSWERGVAMNLVRNDSYNGSVSPDVANQGAAACVDGVQLRFVADTDAQINALKAGEAHIIFTQPQLQFGDELSTDPNFTVASVAGPVYEHWGFNLNNAHLSDPLVREGMALAMDKAQVMSTLYTPLFGDLLPGEGLGNTYWMSNQPQYEDHSGDAGYGQGDVAAAGAKFEEAGYTLNADGIYEHAERGVLSLRVGTTGGNALRELQQQILQANYKDAGVDIVIDNVPGGAYFGEVPFSEASLACANSGGTEGDCSIWDLTQFAWVGGPWPGSGSAAFRTGSGNNAYGFASEGFDAKADECDATIDQAAQDACYNELDLYATTLGPDGDGLVVMPLTQKPSYYGYLNTVLATAAVSPDANSAGPLVNVVDYALAG